MSSTSAYHLGTLDIHYSTTLILPHRGDLTRRCCFDDNNDDDNDGVYFVLTPLPEHIL